MIASRCPSIAENNSIEKPLAIAIVFASGAKAISGGLMLEFVYLPVIKQLGDCPFSYSTIHLNIERISHK